MANLIIYSVYIILRRLQKKNDRREWRETGESEKGDGDWRRMEKVERGRREKDGEGKYETREGRRMEKVEGGRREKEGEGRRREKGEGG